MRLDNIVYRMGLAPSRRAARQFVRHGHIRVNGIKVNIPSYKAKPGETIAWGVCAFQRFPEPSGEGGQR